MFDQPDSDRGNSYPEADEALTRLYSAYEETQARTDTQKTVLSTSFSNLDSLSQAWTQRVLQSRTDVGPPWSLWAVIGLTSALLLMCAIIYDVEKPSTHYSMLAILGV
ncbi:hypothetical protein O6P37_02515 [Mycobacterium sp. CPCC 205372]|uniref:Transmembrane protein n=1 Tax=Mycobacterium hippophais TaxID=3016340 RepID=A0ABT4PMD1_9MYCO|nr:hypothetical protein [Mycobacterium hippophais]MCZ8377726.1 hypothetical protein [Mycobacterium hippophais]